MIFMDCVDKNLIGKYCNHCRKCAPLHCIDCMFYDQNNGCDYYKKNNKCIFKHKFKRK